MALLEKDLVIKASIIPGAGMGLFTKKFIPKGTRIVEYKGRITTWDVAKHDSSNLYMYTINKNHVIDARPYKKALARYANDAQGVVRIKGITNNCWYVNDGLKAYIESKKDIPAGAEIFVDYGKKYWDVYRQNHREETQKEKDNQQKRRTRRSASVKRKPVTKKSMKS